LNRQV